MNEKNLLKLKLVGQYPKMKIAEVQSNYCGYIILLLILLILIYCILRK